MTDARRLVLLTTTVALLVLAAAFVTIQWSDANKIATAVSALTGVAALGASVLAIIHHQTPSRSRGREASGRWLKITETGNRFVIDLKEDGSLVEWAPEDPTDIWTGTWMRIPGSPDLRIVIDKHRCRLTPSDKGFEGFEEDPDHAGRRYEVTLQRC